jgi:hypothetical protein
MEHSEQKVSVIFEDDYPQFISKSSSKTKKCLVTVSYSFSVLPDTYYQTPPGFQFDRYLSYIYPRIEYSTYISFNEKGWIAEIKDAYCTVCTHTGTYLD